MMTGQETDRIHKEITLRATRSRVWRALTDAEEFGEWFGVRFEGAFRVGETISGVLTKYEMAGVSFDMRIERMDAETYFAFRWHPYDVGPGADFDSEPTTLVEMRIEDVDGGTVLTLVESGFDSIPADRRVECFGRNEGGWKIQMENIRHHIDG